MHHFFRLFSLTTIAAALSLGCAAQVSEQGTSEINEANESSEALVQPTEVPTVPVYLGTRNLLNVNDDTNWVYGLFELKPNAKISIHLEHNAGSGPGPVGFKVYKVRTNGKLTLLGVVDGADGTADAVLKAAGGSYVVEVVGDPHPATLALDLKCKSGKCAPKQQPNEMCGGFAGFQCAEGLSCHYPDGSCHVADGAGVCERRPEICPMVAAPVCGCDGVTYGNSCEARAAGATIDHDGACEWKGCVPTCNAIGTKSEGWYDGCTNELIRYEACGGCFPRCSNIGSKSEGWGSTCGGFIKWANCGSTPISCIAKGGVCAATTPGSGPAGWAISSDPEMNCGQNKGLACYTPSCPQLQPPAPTFCPNGTIVPKYDQWQFCISGYECVQ